MAVLQDKVVVITGAGSGLGRALSAAFVTEGAYVVGLGRSEQKLKDTQELVGTDKFSYFVADAGNFLQLKAVVDSILANHEGIDFLYNNAAVYPKVNFLDETAEEFAQAMASNINGVANCCKAVLPHMVGKKSGRIFNLGSWADLSPIAHSAAYSASKGAVRALTKAIAADLADKEVPLDVQVHEWIPGHLNTQMSDYTGIDPTVSAAWGVALATRYIDKQSSIFECDHEWQPPKSLKQKIKAKLFFWKK
jgi:NAD(P)-dependent dehydrogenase (short-subunit alcohol dehydrogenase family)